MQKLSVTKSARIAELNLDADRVSERPSASMSGTVRRILPSRHRTKPEKAQITVDLPEPRYRELRIENSLTDEHGDEVKLKTGARVQVTVTDEGLTEVGQPKRRL